MTEHLEPPVPWVHTERPTWRKRHVRGDARVQAPRAGRVAVLQGRTSGGYRWRCKRCVGEAVTRRHQKLRRLLVAEAGGRCAVCGYEACIINLHFHHVDPTTKAFPMTMARGKSEAPTAPRWRNAFSSAQTATGRSSWSASSRPRPRQVSPPLLRPNRRHLGHQPPMFLHVDRPMLLHLARRVPTQPVVTTPVARRANRPLDEVGGAVRADALEHPVDALGTERALEGADHRLRRLGRQRLGAVLADRS